MSVLYISDLDGTLLDNSGLISPDSSRIISDLTEKGAIVSIATARTPATVEPILSDTLTADLLVVMTGAAIWSRSRSRFVHLQLISPNDVVAMLSVFSQCGLSPFVYALNPDGRFLDVYHKKNELTDAEAVFVDQRAQLSLKGFHLGSDCPRQCFDSVALFFAMGSHELITGVAELLKSVAPDCYVSYYKDTYSDDLWLLEVFGPGVSKAEGVARLRDMLGVESVVAFGDNLNDIPMLRLADRAVVVDNALPQVKAVADVVIGPNSEDAVARYIWDSYNKSGLL